MVLYGASGDPDLSGGGVEGQCGGAGLVPYSVSTGVALNGEDWGLAGLAAVSPGYNTGIYHSNVQLSVVQLQHITSCTIC